MYVTKQHFMQNSRERQDGNPIKGRSEIFQSHLQRNINYLCPLVTEWKEIAWGKESGDLPYKIFFASENKIQEPISSALPLWSLLQSSAFIFFSSWSGRPSTQENQSCYCLLSHVCKERI